MDYIIYKPDNDINNISNNGKINNKIININDLFPNNFDNIINTKENVYISNRIMNVDSIIYIFLQKYIFILYHYYYIKINILIIFLKKTIDKILLEKFYNKNLKRFLNKLFRWKTI